MSAHKPNPFDLSKIAPPHLADDAYGHHGRNLMEEHLALKLNVASRALSHSSIPRDYFLASRQDDPEVLKPVGILGAGVGGLYAAMILHSLDIPFDILEASDRTGGRIFTHHFSDGAHDYFDVGAMRFPKGPSTMERLFHLFNSHQLNSDGREVAKKLIPFIYKSDNTFYFFNNRRLRASQVQPQDQFDFAATGVPQQDLIEGHSAIVEGVIDHVLKRLQRDLVPPGSSAGWQHMMRFDNHSLRSYMIAAHNTPCPRFVDMVTFSTEDIEWYGFDGGARVLPDAMTDYVEMYCPDSLIKNTRVTGLRTVPAVKRFSDLELEPQPGARPGVAAIDVLIGDEKRRYEHVISTIPLPVFRTLDIRDELLFTVEQTNAMRQLSYGPSIKIGIKFKSRWWEEKELNIVGGQSYTDLNIRTTVFPSHGLQGEEQTTVLIASYNWTADAAALAALVASDKEDDRKRLKDIVLRDMSQVHNVPEELLVDQYVEMFPWAWQNDPLTQGAFAFFGPGQFGTLYQSLTQPCGGYHLHMAGEALSPRHAFVVGALYASWRAVEEIILRSYPEKHTHFRVKWGKNQEWIPSRNFLERIGMKDIKWDDDKELDLVLLNMMAHNPAYFNGGSQVLTKALTDFIKRRDPNSLLLEKPVEKLRYGGDFQGGVDVHIHGETKPRWYKHTLDIDDKDLFTVQQTNALRELSYGPSVKIGVKLKTQWWKDYKTKPNGEPMNIVGGQSPTDSYGVEGPNKSTVLVASYTWTSDAASIGALVKSGHEADDRLKDLVLRDLAAAHRVPYEFLYDQWLNSYCWDWQHWPLTQGYLHMAGEALSPRHVWIVGALDASWRAVLECLWIEPKLRHKVKDFKGMWGENEEWVPPKSLTEQYPYQMMDIGEGETVKPDLLCYHLLAHKALKIDASYA
ncbi:hypothetical protein FRB90_001686 [Tulasnella sp. 427]|nr:hypothetical protein FRB90_001686 [Tulasnella sp. 427]